MVTVGVYWGGKCYEGLPHRKMSSNIVKERLVYFIPFVTQSVFYSLNSIGFIFLLVENYQYQIEIWISCALRFPCRDGAAWSQRNAVVWDPRGA